MVSVGKISVCLEKHCWKNGAMKEKNNRTISERKRPSRYKSKE